MGSATDELEAQQKRHDRSSGSALPRRDSGLLFAFDAVHEASAAVTSSMRPRAVLESILDSVVALADADDAYLFAYDGKHLCYVTHRCRSSRPRPRGPHTTPRPDGLTYRVARAGHSIVVPDVDQHELFTDWRWGGAVIGLPLRMGERVIGVMTAGFGSPQTFDAEILRVLDVLMDQAAVTISNTRRRHQLESELAERKRAEARYRRLVDHIPSIICELDPAGITQFVSPAITRITGYQPEALVGQLFWDVLFPGEHQDQVRRLYRTFRSGDITEYEMSLVDDKGRTHWLAWSSANQHHPDGALKRIIMIGMDVTKQHQITDEREELQKQLFYAQRMESLGRLAGGVAHDFNNLLTIILGCSTFVEESLQEASLPLDDLHEVIKAAKRGAALTRQLLIYGRKQHTEPRLLQVNRVVTELQKMLIRLVGDHIRLQSTLAPELPHVLIDPGYLEQVIVNLAANARDAMPAGGVLQITTEQRDMNEGLVAKYASLLPGPHVCLTVSDTGSGMSEDVAARIFEPFFTTKSQDNGTGLGLSTVYGIVKQAQGAIWVRSAPGQGSTFEVMLPVSSKTSPRRNSTSGELPGIGLGECILLVEDNPALRRPLVRFLSKQGYHMLEAEDGVQGWEVYRAAQEKIDLLVTDLQMPDMSGQELVALVREHNPALKVICISGNPAQLTDDEHHAGEMNRVSFLWKPFTPGKLAGRIRSLLDYKLPEAGPI